MMSHTRLSRVMCISRSSCAWLCSSFVTSKHVCAAVFSLTLPPLLVDLVSIGLVSISTDLVSMTVSGGWLPLSELPWIPACHA